MKTTVKNIICSLLFISLIAATLAVGSIAVVPKSNLKEDGMKDATAFGVISEPKDTIDAIFVGDSEVYRSIMPLKIWEDYGITGYVCSTPAQRLYYSLEFLEKAFETQSPKYIFIETNSFFREFTFSDKIENKLEKLVPFFRYHTNIKDILTDGFNLEKIFSSPDYSYTINDKGYRLSLKVRGFKPKNYMSFSKERESISERNISYIKRINDYCKKNGASLVFLSIPSTQNYNYPRHNSLSDFAKQLGVEYVDMNLLQNEIQINWKKDTYDKGDHLNYHGAQKVTAYLGKYLSETGTLSDKRSDRNYESWNDAVDNFYIELKEAKAKRKERRKRIKLAELLKGETEPETTVTVSKKWFSFKFCVNTP